jgi:hemolysin-activating ACP:hemolysin acyltransferase
LATPIHSICAIGGHLDTTSAAARDAQQLGLICRFACGFPSARVALGAFVKHASDAQQVGQLKVYLNGYGDCVGYAIWAFLSPEVEQEFLSGQVRPLAAWEYNEGTRPWILDLFVAPGSLRHVLEDLRDVVFRDHQQVTYRRSKGGWLLCRQVSRSDRTTFMSGRASCQAAP